MSQVAAKNRGSQADPITEELGKVRLEGEYSRVYRRWIAYRVRVGLYWSHHSRKDAAAEEGGR